MFAKPQSEHQWLDQLLGQWTFESQCSMGPDQPSTTMRGQVTARTLGGLWIAIDCAVEDPEHGGWSTLMTVGYDPEARRYVGTFIGSMMTHLWIYSGQLDTSQRKLVLEANGPRCDQQPGVGHYEDSIELVDSDHWILASRMRAADDQWQAVMTAHHHRVR